MKKKLTILLCLILSLLLLTGCAARDFSKAKTAYASGDYQTVVDLLENQKNPKPEMLQLLNNAKIHLAYESGDYKLVEELAGDEISADEEVSSLVEKAKTALAEEAAAEAAEPEETPAVENAETVIAIDEASLTDILSRLDQIIALLTPAAADDIPEEIAEAVEEALEASEAADPMAEEVSAAMEEILEPVASVILEEEGDGEEDPLPETLRTDDALRAALAAVRPVLIRMPKKARRKMAGDIAARLRRTRASGRGTTGTDAYAALASARRRTAPASADLGRRIMEKRNVNYKKN